MRRFAPDPETTVDVAALRVFRNVQWHGPQHRAPWYRDPLGKLSTLAVAVGAVMLFCSIVALTLLGAYTILT